MYREYTKIIINSDYYNKRLSYKCIAGTALCLSILPEELCNQLLTLGYKLITNKLRELNPAYSIQISSAKYSSWRTYKFKGKIVTECSCTSTFHIKYKGELLSSTLARGVINKLIDNNGGRYEFIYK